MNFSSSVKPSTHRSFRPAALALAAALVGVLALPVMAQPVAGMQHTNMAGGHGMRHGDGPGMGFFSERMLDRVNASPEQRSQIKQIMEAARKDMQAQREAGASLRDEAARLFVQPSVDANAAEALRQKRLAQHDQASKRMMQAMLDVSRVLTPQQRQQIAERMQKGRQLMERHHRERNALDGAKS